MADQTLEALTDLRSGLGQDGLRSWPLLSAAGLYVGSWITGLTTAPAAPAPFAGQADVQAFFVAHAAAATLQSVLVHGVSGAALALVVLALVRSLPAPTRTLAGGLGFSAVGASALQLLLMVALASGVDDAAGATTVGLFHAINYVDSVKLLLLGGLVTVVTLVGRRSGLVPRWLGWAGGFLAPLLPISGTAFLVQSDLLFAALYLSLPLLLVWVTGAAIVVARQRRG